MLKELIEGKVYDNVPASFLQLHKMAWQQLMFYFNEEIVLDTDTYQVVHTRKQNIQPTEQSDVLFTELSIQHGTLNLQPN